MKGLIPVGFVGALLIGFLAGQGVNPATSTVSAQATGSNAGNLGAPALPGHVGQVPEFLPSRQPGGNPVFAAYRAEHGKGVFFSGDELLEKFVKKYPLDKKVSSSTHIAYDHSYRLTVMYNGPDGPGIHNDKTHIWYILSGTGRVAIGGEPEGGKAPEEGPVKGASVFRAKPGDWVVVPPYTWHETIPDPGQNFVYVSVNPRTDSIPYP